MAPRTPQTLLTLNALVAGFCLAALLWWLATPGMLGLRDMVVIQRPALSLGALGFGDLPARNAPQDGALAIAGMLFPATWVAKACILGAACAGAWAAFRLGPVAVAVTLWNPFVVERLLAGHWSLVMSAWLIPALLHPSTLVVLLAAWACSITPTGTVLALVLLVVCRRWLASAFCLLCSLPWLVPSLLSTPQTSPTAAFLAHPTLAWLSGGGIWNAEVRAEAGLLAIACALLAALVLWRAPRALLFLALSALALTAVLGLGTWWQMIPGAGMFRDTAKLLWLVLPALITGAGALRTRGVIALGLALTFAQAPTAPAAMGALRGIPEQDWPRSAGDILISTSQGLVNYHGRTMVDPRLKANQAIEAGALTVDGKVIDPPTQRYLQALQASPSELREQGVGLRISGDTVEHIGGVSPKGWRYLIGVSLTVFWLLLPFATALKISRNSWPVRSQE
ncbi:hypothetical protein NQ015_06995 [Corynebacterium sp. 153RC1]|uniref:hypothetical protein n=1 Tax=unclassified Corynebacterium TaxID=2624378 RepID=UPI00211C76D1|nr:MULTISPECIES: hypothetical protein [unclassified Corynebacterium]MCQ9370848.1 hypothetical protein [Corynebacterium sp. 35RC1]MCQ9352677.1 hypothetical protein [Corynebacterium sp. 209RC1]MCQ9354861.1 hypothetical protein [Corynebacterium sp. 1222RC1]MCQ9357046.1 hypothetical protein [Corynebacterium sp. 122RC1]MCQ9359292.1 hypothetical protein [Corynebacterium sp. 142RC1]